MSQRSESKQNLDRNLVKITTRRMPLHYKEDLQKEIDVFLEKELVTPCHSPYSAPAWLVPKKRQAATSH